MKDNAERLYVESGERGPARRCSECGLNIGTFYDDDGSLTFRDHDDIIGERCKGSLSKV